MDSRQGKPWLDESRWARLRRALDDGVSQRECAARFGVGITAIGLVARCGSFDEAKAALAANTRGKRRRSA